MKKAFSVLLSILMVVTMIPLVRLNSCAITDTDEKIQLQIGETIAISTLEGESKYLSFTPDESGIYSVFSTGSSDTYVILYDASYNEICDNDDGGTDANFRVSYTLESNNTYYYEVSGYDKQAADFSVTVEQITFDIQSIEIEDISIIEGTNGYWDVEKIQDEETGRYYFSDEYFYYSFSPSKIILKYKDGTIRNYTGSYWDLEEEFGDSFIFTVNQDYYNQWAAGNTYSVGVSFVGCTTSYNITITESNVESIDVADVSASHGDWRNDFVYNAQTGKEEKTEGYYFYSDYTPNEITVNFNDGTSFTSSLEEFYQQYKCYPRFSSNQSYNNKWTSGNTYLAEVTAMGFTDTYNVSVAESSVQSIEVADVSITENTNGYLQRDYIFNGNNGKYEDTEEYYYYSNFEPDEITVNFKDGTSFTGSREELYQQYKESIQFFTNQSYDNTWTAGNTYEVKVSFLGFTDTFNVTITESPVESIEIADVSIMENTNGYLQTSGSNEYYYYSNFQPDEITVHFKDGTSFTGSEEDLYQQYGAYPVFNTNQSYYNRWTAGNTYEVKVTFLGFTDTFNVTITESPVESIEIADISIIENTNGYWRHDYIYIDDVETEVCYYYYNFQPDEITVNFKDGTSFTGSQEDLYQQYGESLWIFTYQNYENRWTAGNTYEARVSFMGFTDTFNVTITESPVESIEIADVSIMENTNGYWTRDYIDDIETEEYYCYYNYQPDEITVHFKDGTSFTGTAEELYQQYGYYPEFNVNQNYENRWTAGNTYEVKVSFMGFTRAFNVTITESPVESIEIADVSIMENTNGYLRTSGSNEYYYYSNFQPDEITVHFKDGTSFTGSQEDLYQQYGYYPEFNVNQNYENRWTAGNTYEVKVSFMGFTDTFNVTITESPVESIEIADVSIMENTNGYLQTSGSNEYYYYSNFMLGEITVNFKDGTSFTGSSEELYQQYGYYLEINVNQNYENRWTAGNTYEVRVSFMGFTDTFNVTITESPVESIEIADISIIENTNGNWTRDYIDGIATEEYYYYSNIQPDEITVHFKDGTSFTGTAEELYEQYGYYPEINVNQNYENRWTAGNTYEVRVSFMGFTDTFNVTITESPVESIEIADISIIENTNGYLTSDYIDDIETEEYYYYSNIQPDEITVHFKDGTSFTGTLEELCEQYGYYPEININQNYENRWTAGNTYEVEVCFLGHKGSFYVTVLEKQCDLNGDGEVNVNDYAMLKNYVMCSIEMTETQKLLADVNGDGTVDAFDVIQLDLYLNGVVDAEGNRIA